MSKDWQSRTRAVHAGTRRSQYGEVSEAIFLTQGFVYDSAEHAEARFLRRWKGPKMPLPPPAVWRRYRAR